MDEEILVIIAATVTTLAAIGGLVTAWWLWLRHRTDRLRGGSPEEIRALQDSVARLRSEVDAMYGELTGAHQELHERLDFAERLLTRGQKGEGPAS